MRQKLFSFFLVKLLFTVLLCNTNWQLHAQNLNVKRFTNKDGLSQNQCRVLLKDSRDFIWIGTFEGGLNRFDGQKFLTFDRRTGLPSSFIYDLAEDASQNIWIATGNGLSRYNGSNFQNFLVADSVEVKIKLIATDAIGNVWFVQGENKVGYISEDLTINFLSLPEFNGLVISSLFADATGSGLWVGTMTAGLFYLQKGVVSKHYTIKDGLPSNKILHINNPSTGDYIFGTSKGAVTLKDGQISPLHQALQGLEINVLMYDKEERLWAGTNSGTYCIDANKVTRYGEDNQLNEVVLSMVEDKDYGIWFCSYEGLVRLNNEFFNTFTDKHGLPHQIVWSVASKQGGQVWAATEKGIGLLENGSFKSPSWAKEITNSPTPLLFDYQENLLFGHEKFIFRKEGDKIKRFQKKDSPDFEQFIFGLPLKDSSTVLFGGNNGVTYLRNDTLGQFLDAEAVDYFPVNCIAEDRQGKIWLATEGGGLRVLSPNGEMMKLTRINGLPSDVVNTLLIDNDQHVWIGTSGGGLCKIPAADPKRSIITYEELALTSGNIYSLLLDNDANLWVGTDRGLNKILIIQNDLLSAQSFQEDEGFSVLEVCGNAISLDETGHIWVGTVNGLAKVNTAVGQQKRNAPRLFMEGIRLFYETVKWEEQGFTTDSWQKIPNELVLESSQNHLTFNFVAVQMDKPAKVQYQWKLEGLEESWNPPSNLSEATYTNLPPGEYNLIVKASDPQGKFTEDTINYSFSVKNPFYKNRVFLFLTALSMAGIGYVMVRKRLVNMKKTELTLKKKVIERTEEIEYQKNKIEKQRRMLEQALEEIEEKNRRLSKVNQDILNNISYAGRIQQALFFSEKQLKAHFPNSFVFSRIKRLVTGDFFWVGENDSYKYLILLDCTGSGVPAAFVSMVGYNFLDEVMRNNFGAYPAEILEKLHTKVSQLFNVAETEVNDGMDTSVVRISKKNQEILFAGARSSIIYAKSDDTNVIRGNFSSVGILFSGIEAKFEDMEIPFHKGAMLYLLSDGYYSQFNADNKKYKISRLREFLRTIWELPENMQKDAIEKEFDNWKQSQEQMDDVLVVGVRL